MSQREVVEALPSSWRVGAVDLCDDDGGGSSGGGGGGRLSDYGADDSSTSIPRLLTRQQPNPPSHLIPIPTLYQSPRQIEATLRRCMA